jgi:two-component system nitrogen regulation response regulator NtrX
VKLLRALQDGEVRPVGSNQPVIVDVRVLAATNKDLDEEIEQGRFREDLLYRLNVVPIAVPSLRERREDIPELVTHFVQQLSAGAGVPAKRFSADAIRKLQSRSWPGNVRELRNAVERALILASGKVVSPADIDQLLPNGAGVPGAKDGQSFAKVQQESEKKLLLKRLKENDWNISETARVLKITRSNLYKKLKRFEIPLPGSSDG